MTSPATIARYQVRQRLGQGGMGVLYLALDPAIDRLVALKLLRVDDPEVHERFLREARLAARLQHPNIVTVFDVGEHEGRPFIAMEYIPGETLAELIGRRAALSLGVKLTMMADVCSGLAYAHKHGVVHRDVKPANLIVSRDSHAVKILDFGIARAAESTLTIAGRLMGTPNYMSPEQVQSGPIDHRSDIFAVGAVLYELLSYRQAFRADSQAAVLHRIVSTAPEPLATVVPDIDPALAAIVERALSKAAGDRQPDLGVVKGELLRLAQRFEEEHEAQTYVERPRMVEPTPNRLSPDPARVAERRAARLMQHLTDAEHALEQGDPDQAFVEAELAAEIDASDPRVRVLHDRVRHTIETREATRLLDQARLELQAGQLTQAGALLTQASSIATGLPAARELRQALDRAIATREQERERARRVASALEHAREALANRALDAALRATMEALGIAPEDRDALALRQRVNAAIDAKARDWIAAARADAAAGRHGAALRRLESFAPRHEAVDRVIEAIRNELAAIERERNEKEEARRALEVWASATVDDVRRAIGERRWNEAQAGLQALRQRAPDRNGLDELLAQVRDGQEGDLRAERETRERAAAEAKRRTDEEARQRAEAEARQLAEQEARERAAAEAKRRADEEARKRAEVEARRRADEEERQRAEAEARQRAEEEARERAAAEARRRAEQDARDKAAAADAKRRAEEEARIRAEADAKRRADDEARRRAAAEAKRQAKEEARRQSEEQARRRAERDARDRAAAAARRAAAKTARKQAAAAARTEAGHQPDWWRTRAFQLAAAGLVALLAIGVTWGYLSRETPTGSPSTSSGQPGPSPRPVRDERAEAIERAKTLEAAGKLQDAIATLERIQPKDPALTTMIETLRRKAAPKPEDASTTSTDVARSVQQHLQEATALFEKGDLVAAARRASEGLQLDASNGALTSLRQRAINIARSRAERARRRSREAGATDQPLHAEAEERLLEGERTRRSGAPADAAGLFLLAESRFVDAAAAQRAAEEQARVQQELARWAAGRLGEARRAIEGGRWDEAAATLKDLQTRAPETQGLKELFDRVERGRQAATNAGSTRTGTDKPGQGTTGATGGAGPSGPDPANRTEDIRNEVSAMFQEYLAAWSSLNESRVLQLHPSAGRVGESFRALDSQQVSCDGLRWLEIAPTRVTFSCQWRIQNVKSRGGGTPPDIARTAAFTATKSGGRWIVSNRVFH